MPDLKGPEKFRIPAPEIASGEVLETAAQEKPESAVRKEAAARETIKEAVSVVPVMPSVTEKPVVKDRLVQEIESIMESDLTDLFLKMSPQEQQLFKVKGEETIGKIKLLMNNAKKNADKIFSLIRDWLKMIPGVNRFFLEQEAKNKTDKILLLS